jgi:protein-L-isoaspartate(D-aspartate) O-methyltransferase
MNTKTPDERPAFAAMLMRLRAKGIAGRELIAALQATPRRGFIPSQWQDVAWSDRMIPIGCGETMEGVDLQAMILSALQLEPGHRVLEVGTGSGFTAAVLSKLSARVLTIERFRALAVEARKRMEALDIVNVTVKHADGSSGAAAEGPYDRIVVWASFESLPRTFSDQLATNGIMIAPIGSADGEQTLAKLSKVGSRFDREDIGYARLQPIGRSIAAAL